MPRTRGAVKSPATKAKSPKAPKEELFDDEVDEFHAARDKLRDRIALDGGSDDDEDDEAEEEDERLGDTYGLDGSADEDDEDDDEEDESSDEEIKVPGVRPNLDDGDEEEEEDDARGAPRWGRKGAYYGADDIDAEDSDDVEEDERAAKLEEEEARRLQAEQLSLLTEEDFDHGPSFAERAKRKGAEGAAKPAARARAGSALAALDDAFDTVALHGAGAAKLERRPRAAGRTAPAGAPGALVGDEALSAEERLEIVSRDAPELLMLLADLKSKLDETRSRVAPLVAAAASGELRVGGGLGYLQTKLQLLLSYCTHISFFLALKASGAPVREHPVIAQLVRLRAVLEKLGPLDKKLRFQVDRLLQLAAGHDGAAAANGHGGGASGARPNPRALIAKGGEGGAGEESGEEEGEEGERGRKAAKDGIYRPPKLAAVEYDGDAPGGQSKAARKVRRCAAIRRRRGARARADSAVGTDSRARARRSDSAAHARAVCSLTRRAAPCPAPSSSPAAHRRSATRRAASSAPRARRSCARCATSLATSPRSSPRSTWRPARARAAARPSGSRARRRSAANMRRRILSACS